MVWAVSLLTMELILHSLTPKLYNPGIRSLIGFGNLVRSLVHLVLYHQNQTLKANPKAISRRTSYL
jgi:hypothetical protein